MFNTFMNHYQASNHINNSMYLIINTAISIFICKIIDGRLSFGKAMSFIKVIYSRRHVAD